MANINLVLAYHSKQLTSSLCSSPEKGSSLDSKLGLESRFDPFFLFFYVFTLGVINIALRLDISYNGDMNNRSREIQEYIMQHIPEHPRDIVSFTIEQLSISRTTVQRHINHLIKQKKIFKSGNTKNIHYIRCGGFEKKQVLNLTTKLDEFKLFKDFFKDWENQLSKNITDIFLYSFTEIVNNAIEHSLGNKLSIETKTENNNLILDITDNGIGIFQKISNALGILDFREAILELNKGKFTTDPSNHTGEGIFFTSRIFDEFQLIANNISYIRNNIDNDWFVEQFPTPKGTQVTMKISLNAPKTLHDIFNQFQDVDSYKFNKTEITVALSKIDGERYISRSQAKRILRNLEKFDIIILDFKGVRIVGQGFVDEVFRVFKNKFPDIKINYINTNNDVLFMIKRGLNT